MERFCRRGLLTIIMFVPAFMETLNLDSAFHLSTAPVLAVSERVGGCREAESGGTRAEEDRLSA